MTAVAGESSEQPRILVVDDSPTIRKVVSSILARNNYETIDAEDGIEALDVTRRLYRNGDSEYLINGQRVRLKDVHRLLLGTGLTTRAYSIIGQGGRLVLCRRRSSA